MVSYAVVTLIALKGDKRMKRSRVYSLIFLIAVLTYAWVMMIFSLILVETVIMKWIGNSTMRTVLGIGVYVMFLAIWYFSVKRSIERKIRQI